MKLALAFALALVSFNAHAELKAPGTVLSTACAQTVSLEANVCYASVTGKAGSFLTIGNDVWAINPEGGAAGQTEIDHIGFIGAGNQLEYRASMDMRLGSITPIRTKSGDGIKINANGKIVQASDFEIVFNTLSL